MSGTPSIVEAIQAALETGMAELRVGMPGIIQSFDADTQLASVQPCLSDTIWQDGEKTNYDLPVIVDVPVVFYGASTCVITCPVNTGDECWLTFADRSLDGWITSGNTAAPAANYRHNLTDAVVFIGLRSQRNKLPVFDNTKVTVGRVSGSTNAVALADLVRTEVQKLVNWATTHTHPVPGGTSSAPSTPPSDCGSVSSAILQTRE